MKRIEIINKTKPLALPLTARYCDGYWCKFMGLSFQKELPGNESLLMAEDRDGKVNTSIHMLWMYFDLGIVWINNDGRVVDKAYAKKWVSFLAPKSPARYTLEILPDRLAEFEIGDEIVFKD